MGLDLERVMCVGFWEGFGRRVKVGFVEGWWRVERRVVLEVAAAAAPMVAVVAAMVMSVMNGKEKTRF